MKTCYLTPGEAEVAAELLQGIDDLASYYPIALALVAKALREADVIYIRDPEPIPVRDAKEVPFIGTLADYRKLVA